MAQSVIGALRVNLGIDSAQFSKGLKSAETGLSKWGANVAKGLAVVGAAAVAVAGTLAIAMKGVINEADKLAKMSQQIGIPVEELSRLKHAADLSGVSLDKLATGVSRLSRNMNDVAVGAGGEAARAFDQLGISVTDSSGRLKTSSQVMAEMAAQFARMPDGAEKTALAMQLMGRSGSELIPLLNGGSAALRSMMAEADQLGIVITEKTAKAAEAFNDNLTRLKRAFDGIIIQLTAEMLPHLERLSEWLVQVAKDGDLVKTWADGLITSMKWVVDAGLQVVAILQGIRAEIDGMARAMAALNKFPTFMHLGEAREAWNSGQQEFARLQQEMERRRQELWGTGGTANAAGKGDRFSTPAAPSEADQAAAVQRGLNQSKIGVLNETTWRGATLTVSGIRSVDQTAGGISAGVRDVQSGVMTTGGNTVGAIGTGNKFLSGIHTTLQRTSRPGSGGIPVPPTTGTSSVRRAGSTSSSSFDDPFGFDSFGGLGSLTSGTSVTKAADTLPVLRDEVALSGGILDVLNKSLGELQGIRMSIESRTMLVIPAGSILPEGLDLPGFARGGSFTVGGSGGIDSKLAMFKVSPKEQIDITPAGEARGGGDTVVVNNTYNVPVDNRPESINTQLLSWQIARSVQAGQQLSMRAGR